MRDFDEVSIYFSLAISVFFVLFLSGWILSSSQQHQNSLDLYRECEAICEPLRPALVEVNSFSTDDETCFCLGKRGNLRTQSSFEYLD